MHKKTNHAKLDVFADYNQFYLQDGTLNPPAPEDWTDADIYNRAKTADNVVVVCPISSDTVPVEVELFDSPVPADAEGLDHLVECSLFIPSGHFQVHECTGGPKLDWQVGRGYYHVRIGYYHLGSKELENYKIQLWPGEPQELKLVKSWLGEHH